MVNPFHAAPAYYQYDVSYDSAGRPVRLDGSLAGQAAAAVYETAQQGSFGAYDALGRVAVMKADAGNAVSVRVYDAHSGLLTGECKRVGVEVDCLNQTLNAARDIYRTDGPTKATYQGGKLSRYEDRGTGTTYETSYRPSGRVLETKATPGAGPSTLSQDYVEHYTYNGIGNIETVTVGRGLNGPTPLQRTETYATTPWQAPPTPIVDKVKAIEYATTLGSPPARVGVRYGYDLANRLTSVTRTAGESETLAYGPTGELLYRQIGQRFVFYVGEYATVSAAGQAGCAGAACVPQAASVAVDAHVVYAGTRIASARTASQDGTVSGRTLFYYRTRLGSVIGTSVRGSPTKGASYRYTPYGEVRAEGETEATRSELGYTNALRLTGSLWYLKNRVYDAEARVFIQSDWVDRLRYAYVTGDPVNLSDPTGLAAKEAPAEGGGGAAKVLWTHQSGNFGFVYEKQKDGTWSRVGVYDLDVPTQAETFSNIRAGLQVDPDQRQTSRGQHQGPTQGGERDPARPEGEDQTCRAPEPDAMRSATGGPGFASGVGAGTRKKGGEVISYTVSASGRLLAGASVAFTWDAWKQLFVTGGAGPGASGTFITIALVENRTAVPVVSAYDSATLHEGFQVSGQIVSVFAGGVSVGDRGVTNSKGLGVGGPSLGAEVQYTIRLPYEEFRWLLP